nr:hypothetical protein [Tanacetum cinerariifolium]
MSTGGVVNVNEANGMGCFYSKYSNTSHTSIAIRFLTSNDGVSKGISGFSNRANGGVTCGNDTLFASKPAGVDIRESSRSLLDENYDGVDMESTKSILEEISLDTYDELVARRVVGANAALNAQNTFNKATSMSFTRAASSSFSEPKRGKANFRSRVSENVCEGVELLIPMNVVETVSNRLHSMGTLLANGLLFRLWEIFRRSLPVARISVWVKLHDVPLHVFSEIGISLIATQIGKPIMLDSFTSSMCIDSWKRSSFARCLIEVNADTVLKENINIGIPLLDGSGFSKEMDRIEYEWKPPRSYHCKIFCYVNDQYPKNATAISTVDMTNNGFQVVVNKRKQNGAPNMSTFAKDGLKPSSSFFSASSKMGGRKAPTNSSNIPTSNPYDEGDSNVLDDMKSEEEFEIVLDETVNLLKSTKTDASIYTAPDVFKT